jgi:hypothetical protein
LFIYRNEHLKREERISWRIYNELNKIKSRNIAREKKCILILHWGFGNAFSNFGNAFSIFGNAFSIFGNAFSIFGNAFSIW